MFNVRWAFARALLVCLLISCGGGDGVTRLEVEVQYPTSAIESMTGSLHLWVLREDSGDEEASPACNQLVARTTDPYARSFELLVDQVFLLPEEPSPVVDEVARGQVLVYLEAVDFTGDVLLAGCAAIDVSGESVTVALSMSGPGTFDCSDPEVEDGAPCDDGLICTAGETCQAGVCGGGTARDCSFVADSCNSAACDEELGCVKEPLPNGTSCNDGLFCSSGEVCMEGLCVGAERDCSASDSACTVGVCEESFDACVADPLPNGTGCDDGQFCTVSDACTSGFCDGTPRDCSLEVEEDQCNEAVCNETSDECELDPLTGNPCNDDLFCTVSDACVDGECGGTPRDCSQEVVEDQCNQAACNEDLDQCELEPRDDDEDGFVPEACGGEDCNDDNELVNPDGTEGPFGDPTCSDGLDNDCDGDVDGDDEDCVDPGN